jgi:hypothetical protein
MVQKYYNSSETAKILGKTADEVKQMIEHRELHGYRDGADWKFKVEDIDRLAKDNPAPSVEADDDDGDVLLSEVSLGQSDPGLSGTVIGLNVGGRLAVDSGINLGESDLAMSALNEESTATIAKKQQSVKAAKPQDSELNLADDLTLAGSSVVMGSKPGVSGSSVIDLGASNVSMDDDDLVLGGSGTGSDVTLGGDSGISLIDPSDSGFSLETPVSLGPVPEESLELGDDDILVGDSSVQSMPELKTDDEFLLTPLEESIDLDGSESGSQVIALDDSAVMENSGVGVSMAAMLDEDVSAHQSLDMGGMAAPLVNTSILAAQPTSLAEGATLVSPAASLDQPYTGLQIAGLAICTVLMLFCGMLMVDLLRSMWSFEQPQALSSQMMNMILGWIGL